VTNYTLTRQSGRFRFVEEPFPGSEAVGRSRVLGVARKVSIAALALAMCGSLFANAAPARGSPRPPRESGPTNRNTDVVRRAYAEWQTQDGGMLELIEAAEISRGARSLMVGLLGVLDCLPHDEAATQTCVGATQMIKIPSDNFEIDPSLSNARLRLRMDGQVHRMEWRGEGSFHAKEGRVKRPAEATGVVYDDREDTEGASARAVMTSGSRAAWGVSPPPSPFGGMAGASERQGPRLEATCVRFTRAERRFASLANAERKSRGLVPLKLDPELTLVSRMHTGEMIKRNLLSHTAADRLARRVTRWSTLGENIGLGATVTSLHAAFMHSLTHRDNILKPAYRFVGIGTRKAGGRLWVTVTFEHTDNPGTRLSC
jgi:uncharacterized protein YkwD